MGQDARLEILKKLKTAPEAEIVARPVAPPLNELSWDDDKMIARFIEILKEQTGVVYRVKDYKEALAKLSEIAEAEHITKAIASADDIITLMDLPSWGEENGIEILLPAHFKERDSFKQAVFAEVQAGITGANYAIAESGTLVLAHDKKNPRLLSLAPITHIAVVPVERLRPVYEDATDKIFDDGGDAPSQVSFITGPSMTADIQGVPFKGMHGPKRLYVILVG